MESGIETLLELFSSKLRELELEYLNGHTKIVLKKDVPKLVIEDKVKENLKQGTLIQVRRWYANELLKAKIASLAEDQIDESTIIQLEWKERNNPSEVQPLSNYFYFDMKRILKELQDDQRREALYHRLIDIITLRLSKILEFSFKGKSREIEQKLTLQEKLLYRIVSQLVNQWLSYLKETVNPRGE